MSDKNSQVFTKGLLDIISNISDKDDITFDKKLTHIVTLEEDVSNKPSKAFASATSVADTKVDGTKGYEQKPTKVVTLEVAPEDSNLLKFTRGLTATINAIDKISNDLTKTAFTDVINNSMNGRLKLASESYDSEQYFVVLQDYQPSTTLN
jgi:hypothetical protein